MKSDEDLLEETTQANPHEKPRGWKGTLKQSSPLFLLSVALHLILFLLLSLIPTEVKKEEDKVTVITTVEEDTPEEELEEIEEVTLDPEVVEVEPVETEEVVVEDVVEVVEEEAVDSLDDNMEEIMDLIPDEVSTVQDFSNLATLGLSGGASGASGLPSGFTGSRGSGAARAKAAGRKTIQTIDQALSWLAAQQSENGTWPRQSHPNAINGACALAFLGNGNSTTTGKYAHVVKKFVDYYLDREPADAGHGNHGHATPFVIMAMCDALVMDYDNERLKGYCERAVAYVSKTQLNNGGWDGGSSPAPLSSDSIDVAQSAWYVMALVSARFSGIEVPRETMAKAKNVFLELAKGEFKGKINVTSHGGQDDFFDRPYSIPSYASTILIFLGVPPNDAIIARNSKMIIDGMPNKRERNFWQLYNQGLGLFQMGPKAKSWLVFKDTAIKDIMNEPLKDPDGIYWSNKHLYNNKMGISDTRASTNYWGDCGATAMAILNLQVFYRYGDIQEAYRSLN